MYDNIKCRSALNFKACVVTYCVIKTKDLNTLHSAYRRNIAVAEEERKTMELGKKT